MTCERHYTPEAVAELQQIALAVELKRRAEYVQRSVVGTSDLSKGIDAGMNLLLIWLRQLAPDFSQCDNSPEAITAADYTAGLME